MEFVLRVADPLESEIFAKETARIKLMKSASRHAAELE